MEKEIKEHHPLYNDLCSIVGSEFVSDEKFVRMGYTRGPFYSVGQGIRGKIPGIVVRPRSTEEVSEIVKLANEAHIPIVPKGGGGSYATFPPLDVGGEKNIIIDTTLMNRILEIDEDYMRVVTECGVILSKLSNEVRKRGFHIHVADCPIHMDAVGGLLSGWVGGGEPSDFATAGFGNNYVIGLKVVLPTGDIIQTGSGPGTNIYQNKVLLRDAGSPDITGIFIGDGGCFGIKTEAVYSISPYPTSYTIGVYDMGPHGMIWKAFNELVSTEPYPYTRLIAFHERGGPWLLFYVIRGNNDEEVSLKRIVIDKVCLSFGGKPRTTEDGLEMASLLSPRQFSKKVFSIGTTMSYFGEAIIPRLISPEYLDVLNSIIDEKLKDLDIVRRIDFTLPYLRAVTVTGVLLYFGKGIPREEVNQKLYELTINKLHKVTLEKFGGFMETHQGEISAISESVWSPVYRSFMKNLKKALDPNNILMPNLWRF